jgi:hypothetical protein
LILVVAPRSSAQNEKVVKFFLARDAAEAMIGEVREDEPMLRRIPRGCDPVSSWHAVAHNADGGITVIALVLGTAATIVPIPNASVGIQRSRHSGTNLSVRARTNGAWETQSGPALPRFWVYSRGLPGSRCSRSGCHE